MSFSEFLIDTATIPCSIADPVVAHDAEGINFAMPAYAKRPTPRTRHSGQTDSNPDSGGGGGQPLNPSGSIIITGLFIAYAYVLIPPLSPIGSDCKYRPVAGS